MTTDEQNFLPEEEYEEEILSNTSHPSTQPMSALEVTIWGVLLVGAYVARIIFTAQQ